MTQKSKNSIFSILATTLLLLSACTSTPESRPPTDADYDAVTPFFQSWRDALQAGNPKELAPFYADSVAGNAQTFGVRDWVVSKMMFWGNHKEAGFSVTSAYAIDSVLGEKYFCTVSVPVTLKGKYGTSENAEILMVLEKTDGNFKILSEKDDIRQTIRALIAKRERNKHSQDIVDEKGHLDSELLTLAVEDLEKNYGPGASGQFDQLLFYSRFEKTDLFYALRGKAENDYEMGWRLIDGGKMGILDKKGNVIVPFEFDKIYNFNTLFYGAVAVEDGGKLGLYDHTGRQVLAAEYESLLPDYSSPTAPIVRVKKDGAWGWANLQGKVFFAGDAGGKPERYRAPDPRKILRHWPVNPAAFDPESGDYQPLPLWAIKGDEKSRWYPAGHVFPPAFMVAAGLMPEHLYAELDYAENMHGFAIDTILALGDSSAGFLTMFETWGVGGREEYHEKAYKIETFDPRLRRIWSENILDVYDVDEQEACLETHIRFIAPDTIETVRLSSLDNSPYTSAPVYEYIAIHPNGVNKLRSNRTYKFTEFVAVTADHFRGCFEVDVTDSILEEEEQAREAEREARGETDEEEEEYYDEWYSPYHYYATEHLTLDDLDQMYFEILAEKGYIIQDPKWKRFFEKHKWYEPQYENVDSLLSPLDARNLKFIWEYKKKMQGKESGYINRSFESGSYY